MFPPASLSVELFTAWSFFLRSDFVLRGPRQSPVSGLGTRLQAHEFDLLSHPLHTRIGHSEEQAHARNGLLFEKNSFENAVSSQDSTVPFLPFIPSLQSVRLALQGPSGETGWPGLFLGSD